jgi:hypothetical protein
MFVTLAMLSALPARGQEPKSLVAAIGTDGLILHVGNEHCRVFVLLANESNAPINISRLDASLFVDGRLVEGKLADAFLNSGQGPILTPGGHAGWGAMLDLFVKKPGWHRIMWKGRGFVSNEARFLLLPPKK